MVMQEYERYRNLHTIIMLEDVIRKWWGLELAFADRSGHVLRRPSGRVIPTNDLCRLSLSSKEGKRRCEQSVRFLGEKLRSASEPRGCLFHECHLDLAMVGCPVVVSGEYKGFLFACGFAREPSSRTGSEQVESRIRLLDADAMDLDRAVARIPRLGPSELDKLRDLLDFGAGEVAAFDAEAQRRDRELRQRSGELEGRHRFDSIVGKSAAMQSVFGLLEKVCSSDSTVLVQGESGTGKELVARAIHYNGPRRDAPFVVQNCSAFNDNLLESALFGHAKGAFTGAVRDKKGLFEVADGGTFFLDEVGDMSPALQVKLLRVLQEGTFTPVGSTQTREVDVRVIAATHKDLQEMVERGEFREDLFYRVNVIRMDVPALRERRDDIPLLVNHFLEKHARGGRPKQVTRECMTLLTEHQWPGNIRELENEIERLVVLGSDQDRLDVDLVSPRIREAVGPPRALLGIETTGSLKAAVEDLEKEMIHQGLVRTHWNKSRLARELGISRSNLIAKCEKYGFAEPARRTPR